MVLRASWRSDLLEARSSEILLQMTLILVTVEMVKPIALPILAPWFADVAFAVAKTLMVSSQNGHGCPFLPLLPFQRLCPFDLLLAQSDRGPPSLKSSPTLKLAGGIIFFTFRLLQIDLDHI